MPEATDAQMQSFSDQRIRPFAEAWELLVARAREHKAAIDDAYARATGTNQWSDARTDGPPHLLQSGNGMNPDDLLNFNSLVTNLISLADSVPTTQADKAAAWDAITGSLPVLSRAVVRVIGN